MKTFSLEEVKKHNNEKDIYIIVENGVYNLSNFLEDHPGGKKILLNVAGQNATKQFWKYHNQAILDKYRPELLVGVVGNTDSNSSEQNQNFNEKGDDFYERGLNLFGDLVPYGDPNWYQGFESPYYNESHKRLRLNVRKFFEKEIAPYVHEWDEAKQIPKEIFQKCAKTGLFVGIIGTKEIFNYSKDMYNNIFGIKFEEFDAFHESILIDEMSRCGSGGFNWGVTGGLSIGLPPIVLFGSQYLKDKVVRDCLKAERFICLAITEPSAGSDVANILCEAKKSDCGNYYIVNGEKKWITNAVFSDYFTTAVRTGGKGMGGISLLLIERNLPGVKTRQMKCSGVWSSGTTYISFEDVKVPVKNLIGKENEGFKYIMYNFNHERLIIIYMTNRFSRVCYEEALKYAKKRKTFGKLLIDHPVIRDKFANMSRQIEACQAWIENITYQLTILPKKEQASKLGGPIALLKAHTTKTLEYCCREAAQIFGGLSYTRGGQGEKVERLNREVRSLAIPGGSEEIMLDLGMRQAIKSAKTINARY